jgi:hypothetical protein
VQCHLWLKNQMAGKSFVKSERSFLIIFVLLVGDEFGEVFSLFEVVPVQSMFLHNILLKKYMH